ncbi:hypothetical protein Ddye_022430 [Dipteronia dyeriana]|uniref:Uncharacterized protein n=1 Tax=Dipteronia dyeriana TaxID=168575 RepID=A0AAD9WYX5_9ROSI|nr:hypothetical protein Ddye_022430 [Dipteronia dyeriana]
MRTDPDVASALACERAERIEPITSTLNQCSSLSDEPVKCETSINGESYEPTSAPVDSGGRRI